MQQIVRGTKEVIVTDIINESILSEYRATILSIESFWGRIFLLPLMVTISYLVGNYTLTQTLNIMAIVGVIFYIALLSFIPSLRYKRSRDE